METEERVKQLNRERRQGHRVINWVSMAIGVAGVGRWIYELVWGRDVSFGREALVLGIAGAAAIYFLCHLGLDTEINEKIEKVRRKDG